MTNNASNITLSAIVPLLVKSIYAELIKYNMKRIIPNMQKMTDNFLFSYFLLYLENIDMIITIKAKASKKINRKEYCGIVAMHISIIATAPIKNIISFLFIKSPIN